MKLDSSITAVVTGGASGLGEATVRALAGHGVKVAILDLERQREKGEAVARATVEGMLREIEALRRMPVSGGK